MMKRVGFVGLGTMGRPMALNLLNAGYEMCVCDIVSDATEELKAAGARVLDHPFEVAEASEVVMTMLPDSPEVEEVYLGEKGLLSGAHKGLILIDSSTIDPETTLRIGREVSNRGAVMMDAPVGGNAGMAVEGKLIMLVGGNEKVLEECRGIFEVVGQRIIHAGPLGSGEALKLTNNLITGIYNCVLAEGFSLADRVGVDREKLLAMLSTNLTSLFGMLTTRITERDFKPGFTTGLMHKDLRLAQKLAQSNNAPLPFGGLAKEMYQFAINQGCKNLDFTSLITLYDEK